MTDTALHRCSMCQRLLPLTDAYWYFHKTGPLVGQVTGYCRDRCHNAYSRARDAALDPGARARRRLGQRDSMRRLRGYDPDRYRRSKYETLPGLFGPVPSEAAP